MNLIKDIIERRMSVLKDLELNNEDYKSIWHFYQIYQICANVMGIEIYMKERYSLLIRLLYKPDDLNSIIKLKNFVLKDNSLIQTTLESMKEIESDDEIIEDFYPISVFAINLEDRNL